MMSNNSRYQIKHAAVVDKELVIDWQDAHQSRYHPIWLRHHCECESCGSSLDAVRSIRIHHIPEDIFPTQIERSDDGVSVNWSNDAHGSRYTARWLRDHCNADSERARRKHKPVLWNGSIADNLPAADFIEAASNDDARLAMLQTVCDYGFCTLSNMPTDAGESHRPVELFGPQRHTHFGTYKLAKKSNIRNVGDVTAALDPHVDETYRMSTIGITVFQVIRPSNNGGESTLMDGFEAARRLRENFPDDFELLCNTPITGHRFDEFSDKELPKWYVSRQPIIKIDEQGDVCGVRINERQMAPLDAPANIIGDCYRALRRFMEIVYGPDLRVTFDLKAGDGLVFNNQRVLHGRTAFIPEQPGRSVLTSSVDLEEFYSTLRVLKMRRGDDEMPKQYAQGLVF